MSSIFTQIIEGKIPSFKLLENDQFYSFLDIRPISPGHTLVIPKLEIDHFYELPDSELSGILKFAQPLVKALEKTIPCLRVGSLIAGLEVPHAHLHLVPIQDMSTFSFAYAKEADMSKLKELQIKLLAALHSE